MLRGLKTMRCETRLAYLGVAVAALAAPGLAAQGQDQDRPDDALALAKREAMAYVKAFNARRAKDVAALLTRDADFAFLQGSSVEGLEYALVTGRAEIVGCHETLFSVFPDSHLEQTVLNARLVRPDLLFADVEFEITGLPKDSGPIRGRALVIRVKEAGAWKIAAERNVSKTPPAR
jgi:uncharacterized protein (TIGR02246 family)